MAGVNRTTGRSAAFSTPILESSLPNERVGQLSPPAQEAPPVLRRRTETGHVAGASRPTTSAPRVAELPPPARFRAARAPEALASQMSRVPEIIDSLSARVAEVAQTISSMRARRLDLLQAERQIPDLSLLVGNRGFWRPLQDLQAASAAMISAGHLEGVMRLIGQVNSFLMGRPPGGAESSAAAQQRQAATPKFEVPRGIELSELGEDWWKPAAATTPKLEIPSGIDLDQLDDEWWTQKAPKSPGGGKT